MVYQDLQQGLISRIQSWSNELSLASLSGQIEKVEQKIFDSLKSDPHFDLDPSHTPTSINKDNFTLSSSFKIPLNLYTLPNGHLEILTNHHSILVTTLTSKIFLLGLGVLSLILFIGLYIYTYLNLLRQQKTAIESLIETRNQVTQNLLHDLKSPLTLLSSLADSDPSSISLMDYQSYIQKLNDRFRLLISQFELHSLSNIKPESFDACQLESLIQNLCDQIHKQTDNSIDISVLSLKFQSDSRLLLPKGHFSRLLQNILLNAAEANIKNAQTRVTLKIELTTHDFRIEVIDQGSGFSGPRRSREIFSERKDPGARGIGLISVQECLHVLNGQISFKKLNNTGTRVTIKIPAIFKSNSQS